MLTCSNDFDTTAKSVIAGLNGAGFSKDDYRQNDFRELDEPKPRVLEKMVFWSMQMMKITAMKIASFCLLISV